jgi:hypothetical protein
MLPLFTYPLAFWGLLAVPALVAIYWLRNRYRRYPVSSLMLWEDPRRPREGGTRIHRLQTPLLFLLELLAILLLVLAAADPQVQTRHGTRPLVVVLDDSFSMLAGGADSARARGVQAIKDELRRSTPYSVRFLLAGDRPQALGEPVKTAGEAVTLLEGWRCRAASSALAEAMSLAAELGGDRGLILVITDHGPPEGAVPEKGRVQWWAFGSPRPNLAFVTAARTARDGAERCLLEVANLSDEPQTTTLVVEAGDPAAEVQRSTLRLAARQTHRVVLQLKEDTPALRARLGDDALAIDNQVTLLPAVQRAVRVDLQVADKALRPLVQQAVRSVRGALVTTTRPDIAFTDREEAEVEGADTWVVRLLVEKEAEAYTGPFVTDKTHPLTEGLGLQGVIWGAGKTRELAGAPVVMAGNVPLLTDAEGPGGRHDLRLRLRPDLSTLQDSPNWPALVWNLLRWRGAQAPGLIRPNVRLGEEAVLTLATPRESVRLVGPDRKEQTLPVQGKRVVARAEDVGVYEVRAEGETYSFAANALARDESDLTGCAAGRWGDWLDDTSLRLEYQGVGWVVLLGLLAVVGVHLVLVARGGKVYR